MHAAPEKLPDFMQRQFAFAAAIRDPENSSTPNDVEPRRMHAYQELFFNNFNELLGNTFPVLRRISSDKKWHHLVRDFMIEHRARTPLFPELPQEFVAYLQNERKPRGSDFPFMAELAHYEWAELALAVSPQQINEQGADQHASLLTGIPLLSPLFWLCSYRYPVHHIGPDFIPRQADAETTHLLIYRDRQDAVGFMQLNPISMLLLQRLKQNEKHSGEEQLRNIAREISHPNPATVVEGGLQVMKELRQRDVILGTKK